MKMCLEAGTPTWPTLLAHPRGTPSWHAHAVEKVKKKTKQKVENTENQNFNFLDRFSKKKNFEVSSIKNDLSRLTKIILENIKF